MKRVIILIWIFLFLISGFALADPSSKQSQADKPKEKVHTKTYILQNIDPRKVEQTLKAYFYNCSYDRSGNMFTVVIPDRNLKKFEQLLKTLDVEKKTVVMRIFTVIASHEKKPVARGGEIINKDLNNVLNQLQKVLSFKSYRIDGVSALTVKDGQNRSRLRLSSSYSLDFQLSRIYVKDGKVRDRNVGFEFELRKKELLHFSNDKEPKATSTTLLASETTIKENGYLVAGVSKIGKNGDSLVLVINVVIQ